MRLAAALLSSAALFALAATVAPPTGAQESEIRIDRLDLGEHWYGAEVAKQDLVGKVVLVELWGS